MIKKFLATASAVSLVAGTASALTVTNISDGQDAAGEPVVLAAELDYAAGITSTPGAAAAGQTEVAFSPTGAAFPSGNLTLYVTVEGATFTTPLAGTEVSAFDGGGVAVPGFQATLSQGGAAGTSTVSFNVSGADNCAGGNTCTIDLPLTITGDADVVFNVGLETDAGQPVDNSSDENRVSETVIDIISAWNIAFAPDATNPIATLASSFQEFDVVAPNTNVTEDLGDIIVGPNAATGGAGTMYAADRTVNTDLAGADVDFNDVASLTYSVSGDFSGIDSVSIGGVAATINAGADTATVTDAAVIIADFPDTSPVLITTDAADAPTIQRSGYTATATIVEGGTDIQEGAEESGALASVEREGTTITFPWTQSADQAAGSGVNSVYRFGNLSSTAVNTVFIEVKNSTESGFQNQGVVDAQTAIPANGELVLDSTQVQALVGNYGRGDLEFTLEGQPQNLTGRQYVIRGGNLDQVVGGTVEQDQQ